MLLNNTDLLAELDKRYGGKVSTNVRGTASQTALATIDPSYISGLPRVTFETTKEQGLSGKGYSYLSSYLPVASDKVILAQIGSNWVILGKVDATDLLEPTKRTKRATLDSTAQKIYTGLTSGLEFTNASNNSATFNITKEQNTKTLYLNLNAQSTGDITITLEYAWAGLSDDITVISGTPITKTETVNGYTIIQFDINAPSINDKLLIGKVTRIPNDELDTLEDSITILGLDYNY